jgi:hypothetical protein
MKTSHAPSLRHIAACALLAAVAPAFAADIPSNLKNAAQSKYRDAALQIPNYDPNAQTFVHQPPKEGVENRAAVKVTLPPQAKPGEHPRLLLTKEEVAKMRESLTSTERGKQTYATLLKIADGALAGGGKPTFPDPKGTPSQLKDRNDPIMKQHDRLSHSASALGMAYLFSNNKKYADAAAAILKGYADLYPQYPEHKGVNRSDTGKISAQRLSESMWLIPLIEAYDAIYDSGSLTDADKKNIEQNLLLEAVTFIRRKGTPAEEAAARTRLDPNWRTSTPPRKPGIVGNWLNFYAAATMLTGAAIDNKDLMDLAAADYRTYLQNGISDDGMWGEGAIGYQLFALSAMTTGIDTAARHGYDLWSFEDSRIKMLFDSPLWYAYPDSTLPGINDSGRVKMGDWTTMVYDYGYLRFGDQRYASLVNRSPRQLQTSEGIYTPTRIYEKLEEPAAVSYPSMVFKNLGYAILRDKNRYVLLNGSHPTGVHVHLDKLNLILFDGDELGGEPKFHRYEDPLHDEWTKRTVAHNTMSVDEKSQAIADAKITIFEDAGDIKVMRGETANAYPGVLLDRTVVLIPNVTLDIFRGSSNVEHTWDVTNRYQGNLDAITGGGLAAKLGTQDGYQHLEIMGGKMADSSWTGTWDTTVGKMNLVAAGVPQQKLFLLKGPDNDQIALFRQKGESALFAKTLKLEKNGLAVSSARLLDTGSDTLVHFQVQQNNSPTDVYISYAPGKWKTNNIESDAKVLVITGDTTVATGATFLTRAAEKLTFPAPGNYVDKTEGPKSTLTSSWQPSAEPAPAPRKKGRAK